MATIRQLPSKRWQARVSKDGKESSIGTFRTKKEAEIAAAKVEERIYYGQTLSDRNITFGEVTKKWYKYKQAIIKEETFTHYKSSVEEHILPEFQNKKLMQIRRSDITEWLNDCVKKTYGKKKEKYAFGSILKWLSLLKSIFHYAVYEIEVLEKNPADKLKVPVQDHVQMNKDKEVKYYSLGELNQLLEYMKGYKHQRYGDYQLYYTLMYFLSETGLRISEALALRWTDIEGNQLNVERQVKRDNNNKLKLDSLKNTSSYRTIRLDEDVLKELKKFKIKQNEMILSNKAFNKNSDDIIFQNYLGNYLTPSTVRESIQKYCKSAGVGYKGTHGFRHTHAVLLLEAGAGVKFVADRLGHKTTKTTYDTYLATTRKIEEDELQKFASYKKKHQSKI